MSFLNISYSAVPQHWQMLFQKPATTMMEGIIDLHHDILTFEVLILIFVSLMLATLLVRFMEKPNTPSYINFYHGHNITHNTVLETIWTIIPTVILLLIATPSFALIYALDEVVEPQLTVRAIGRQWYWTYEYPDAQSFSCMQSDLVYSKNVPTSEYLLQQGNQEFASARRSLEDTLVHVGAYPYVNLTDSGLAGASTPFTLVKETASEYTVVLPGFSFDSYIVNTEDLFPGSFRVLEVDKAMVLPVLTNVRLLVSAYDVIHSWAVPSLGIKLDGIPGRVNEYFLHINFLGSFYGQCSELCGVNHGFMPIKVMGVTADSFLFWFAEQSVLENSSFRFSL